MKRTFYVTLDHDDDAETLSAETPGEAAALFQVFLSREGFENVTVTEVASDLHASEELVQRLAESVHRHGAVFMEEEFGLRKVEGRWVKGK